MSAEQSPPPVGMPTLRAWRRTGCILCVSALVCFTGFVALARGLGTIAAVLELSAFVLALIGLGFLRRPGQIRV